MPDDFKKFKYQVLNDDIYEVLMRLFNKGLQKNIPEHRFEKGFNKNRNIAKEIVFQYIWYSPYQSRNTDNVFFKIFAQEYPTVAKALNHFKSKGKSNLPIELQQKEAQLFLDKIGKELISKRITFLTIHDSVLITNDEDLKFTKQLIEDVIFKEFGVYPKLSVKRF